MAEKEKVVRTFCMWRPDTSMEEIYNIEMVAWPPDPISGFRTFSVREITGRRGSSREAYTKAGGLAFTAAQSCFDTTVTEAYAKGYVVLTKSVDRALLAMSRADKRERYSAAYGGGNDEPKRLLLPTPGGRVDWTPLEGGNRLKILPPVTTGRISASAPNTPVTVSVDNEATEAVKRLQNELKPYQERMIRWLAEPLDQISKPEPKPEPPKRRQIGTLSNGGRVFYGSPRGMESLGEIMEAMIVRTGPPAFPDEQVANKQAEPAEDKVMVCTMPDGSETAFQLEKLSTSQDARDALNRMLQRGAKAEVRVVRLPRRSGEPVRIASTRYMGMDFGAIEDRIFDQLIRQKQGRGTRVAAAAPPPEDKKEEPKQPEPEMNPEAPIRKMRF